MSNYDLNSSSILLQTTFQTVYLKRGFYFLQPVTLINYTAPQAQFLYIKISILILISLASCKMQMRPQMKFFCNISDS